MTSFYIYSFNVSHSFQRAEGDRSLLGASQMLSHLSPMTLECRHGEGADFSSAKQMPEENIQNAGGRPHCTILHLAKNSFRNKRTK